MAGIQVFLPFSSILVRNLADRTKILEPPVWTGCEEHSAISGGGGKAHKESSSQKHNQKAPEDMSFIREKTYTLPITLARGLRIRARTKKRKKRRTEKPGGVPTHSWRSVPFQGTLGPQANCRSGPKKKSRHHEVDVSSGTQLFSRSTWEAGLKERDQERHH